MYRRQASTQWLRGFVAIPVIATLSFAGCPALPTSQEHAARRELQSIVSDTTVSYSVVVKWDGIDAPTEVTGDVLQRLVAAFAADSPRLFSSREKRLGLAKVVVRLDGETVALIDYFDESVYSYKHAYFRIADDPLIEIRNRVLRDYRPGGARDPHANQVAPGS
jgi:hypothetical protein